MTLREPSGLFDEVLDMLSSSQRRNRLSLTNRRWRCVSVQVGCYSASAKLNSHPKSNSNWMGLRSLITL